jgi:hypothetical protein
MLILMKDKRNSILLVTLLLSANYKVVTDLSWSGLLEKPHFLGRSRNVYHFMELEGSLLCMQELATGLYPEPDESNVPPPILVLSDAFFVIIPSMPLSP